MKRITLSVVITVLLAGCGGGTSDPDERGSVGSPSDATSTTDVAGSGSEGSNGSTGDGTRLLVASPLGGIDLIDLSGESQEQFVEPGAPNAFAGSLRVVGDRLWFAEEDDLVWANALTGEVEGRVSIPEGVTDFAVSDTTVWVLNGFLGATLIAVDIDSMSITGTVTAPEGARYVEPVAMGADVWVFGGDPLTTTSIARIDASGYTQELTVDIGIIGESVIIGGGSIWVGGTVPAFFTESGNPESAVARLDLSTGEVLQQTSLGEPDDIVEVAYAFDSVWAGQGLSANLHRIDPTSGEILTTVDTGDGAAGIPNEIYATANLIWLYNPTADTIQAYDPTSVDFVEGINVPVGASRPVFAP